MANTANMTIEKGVAIVGGGPAGLYLSILLRATNPELEVTVHERNTPQDAYGFGVVFSDETLDNFENADPVSHRALVDEFRHWGRIRARHPEGVEIVSGGHGFAAISRRTLLETLTGRALELGVRLRFSSEVTSPSDLGVAGVLVGADGANSTVRRELETDLGFSIEHARNKYVWFGTPKVFDEFNFIFEDTPSGMVWAHIYPYGAEGSTFIVEMRPETWSALGFEKTQDEVFPPGASDDYALQRCEEIFASHLDGLGLLGNNSRWLQFPTIGCERWHHGNVVLMGDAVHTAHFSVGSGTKLAMEDAIALAGQLNADQPLEEAFARYEEERRPEVESLQRAAKASRDWFEGADRYRNMEPEQFVFSMLTRSQRITYDNLRVRDPGYMSGIDVWYASSEHSCPGPVGP
ncbi:MAG TPA: FAD-dependent monooxygenase, partial [Acidimicrobiia bacterium]|nr:FAD-dependent monooxygenase [Acidimicrobiia bacterium]